LNFKKNVEKCCSKELFGIFFEARYMTLEHFGTITAKKRAVLNKNSLKLARKNGEIPTILYGKISGNSENIQLFINAPHIEKIIQDPSIMTRVFALKIDEKNHLVLIKDIQYHPVTNHPIHLDFIEVNAKSIAECIVPIRAVNQERCEQIKRGGVIFMLSYNIRVRGLVKKMPNSIDVDVENLKIGDIIFAKNYSLPEGCAFAKNIPLLKMTGKRVVDAPKKDESATNNATNPGTNPANTSSAEDQKNKGKG
jgi:large subunit ribosomal protein L25